MRFAKTNSCMVGVINSLSRIIILSDLLFQVGDFVLFMSYVRQLYTPLNFFGTYYRWVLIVFMMEFR